MVLRRLQIVRFGAAISVFGFCEAPVLAGHEHSHWHTGALAHWHTGMGIGIGTGTGAGVGTGWWTSRAVDHEWWTGRGGASSRCGMGYEAQCMMKV